MSWTRRSTSILLLALAVLFVLACCAPLPAHAQADGDAEGAAALVAHQKEKQVKAQEKAEAEAGAATGSAPEDATAADQTEETNPPIGVPVPKFHRFRNRLAANPDAPAESADAAAAEGEADAEADVTTSAAAKLKRREARERSRESIEDERERQETKREDREDKLEAELQKEEAALDIASADAASDAPVAPRKPVRKQPRAAAGSAKRLGSKSEEEVEGEAAEREMEGRSDEADEQPRSPISDEQLKACPRGCSGHGECFLPKGSDHHICACSEGYEGPACDEAVGSGSGDGSPSFLGTLLLLVLLIVGVERSVWLYKKKCVASESAHDTAGFSRVATTIDTHDDQLDAETFRDEKANDRL